MIVDVHTNTPTHKGPVPEAERRFFPAFRQDKLAPATVSWEDYLLALAGVDRACVFGVRLKDSPVNVNDATAEFAHAFPDRLVGFMSVHPEEDNVVEEMERCFHALGLKGIKLAPNYQGFDPLSMRALQVYSVAQRLCLPILFHQGTSPEPLAPLRYAHPLIMDEIAMRFPELRIVMAHLGHPWQTDTFMVIRKHPHVFADISSQFFRPWSQYNALRLATEWNVLDKLLFGTDYPVATPQETMEGLLSVNQVVEGTSLPRVPEDPLREIIHRDSLTLLGIHVGD